MQSTKHPHSLPFLVDNDCALGLAVNAYLDEIASHPNPPSPETKKNVKVRGAQELFIYSKDYAGDIDRAFYLWDAVYKGIQVAGDMFPERQVFDEANTWLAGLR